VQGRACWNSLALPLCLDFQYLGKLFLESARVLLANVLSPAALERGFAYYLTIHLHHRCYCHLCCTTVPLPPCYCIFLVVIPLPCFR
jgi:hypothetical protein